MASSNRHWPSMFKSKPCNTTHHQWQHHDLNSSLLSSHKTPYTPGSGCEERTPEPKPRWNPRPEQIRILEAIFNSGMVNPPRDEIRKIRAQLQEYGQVGDANVFYWFQNRKSRSKHKQRQLQNNNTTTAKSQPTTHLTTSTPPPPTTTTTTIAAATAPNSSSSSSDKSSPNNSNEKISVSIISPTTTVIDLLNSPTASVNQQPFLQAPSEFLAEPFFFPVHQNVVGSTSLGLGQGFCYPDHHSVGGDHHQNFLLSELMLMSHCPLKKDEEDDHEKMKLGEHLSYAATAVADPAHPFLPPSFSAPSPNILLGVGENAGGPTSRSTVFINDVCFEVGVGPFNVREAFGDDAVLIQSSGQPVLTNEWGLTVHPLQHGAFYYLLRSFTPSPDDRTIDLI